MKHHAKMRLAVFAFLVASLLMSSLPVSIGQGVDPTYDSRATADTTTGGLTVTWPTRAYDGSMGTYAITGTGKNTYGGPGTFEMNLYGPVAGAPRGGNITQVDFEVSYKYFAPSGDSQYQISYWVNPSATETNLKGPIADPGTYNLTFASQAEPNDGLWSWEDIYNIRFVWTTTDARGGDTGGMLQITECWVTVHYYTPEVYVDPQTQSVSVPFSIDLNVTNIEELYGFEFKLYYNTAILTATGVTLGPFLNTTAGGTANTFGFIKAINDVAGYVWFTQTILGDRRGGNVASGSWGILATVSFSIDASGTSDLNITTGAAKSKLAGYNFAAKKTYKITHNAYNGSVTSLAVPEFPLGAAIEIALVPVIIYIFWRGKHKRPVRTSTPALNV